MPRRELPFAPKEVRVWIMDLGVIAPKISVAQIRLNTNSLSCDAFFKIKIKFSEVPITNKVVVFSSTTR